MLVIPNWRFCVVWTLHKLQVCCFVFKAVVLFACVCCFFSFCRKKTEESGTLTSTVLNVVIMRPSSLGGGRILRRTLSVCLSVCLYVRPVIVTERHVAPPSELQWHVLRAAYRTAISAAQILVCYVVQEFHKHQTLNTVQCLLHIVYNNQTHVVYRWYTNIHWDYGPTCFSTTKQHCQSIESKSPRPA